MRVVLRVTYTTETAEMVVNRAYSGEIKCRPYRTDLLHVCLAFSKGDAGWDLALARGSAASC